MKIFGYAAAALALIPSVGLAQTEDSIDWATADPAVKPQREIVITGLGSQQAIEKSGQSISVFEHQEIETSQALSVSDFLARVQGATVTRNGGIGGFSAVRIRGAEGEQTLPLIDGVRVNDPSSPGGGFDFGNLLIGNIQRIEVLRGPNSVPWGSQAIGGVVNIVTDGRADSFGRAEYGYRDAINLVGQTNQQIGPAFFMLGGGYFRDDGISAYRDGIERDGYRQYATNGKIYVDVTSNLYLDLRAYYANSRAQIDGFPPPFFTFSDTTEFSTSKQLTAYAGANLQLLNDRLKNRLALTLSDINRDNFDAPGQSVPSFLARGRNERIEYQGDFEILDGRYGETLRAVFGVEHERSRFTDGFSPARTSVTSGYAQLIFDPSDTLTLTGGARLDDHKTYGSKAAFGSNFAWRPTENTIIRAAFGKGFKAPTLFQLFSPLFGNTVLEPETAKSFEVGIEQALIDGALKFGATLFQRDTRNQIDFISCFGQTTGICTNRPFGTYDNVDRARAKGVEAFARMAPIDTLTMEAKYTLIDAKDRVTGLTLLRRPKHNLNLSIDWEARNWLSLGASFQTVSDSADVDFQTFARARLDGYALVTLRAAIPVNDRFEFYGRVENLTNERYETVSGYGTYGRNAHIGLRARF